MYYLDADSREPMYQQLYSQIKKQICIGELLAGEKLPSTRLLSDILAVSRSTVDMAYSQLLSEGYIFSKPYKGYYVERAEEFLFDQQEYHKVNVENKKRLDDRNEKSIAYIGEETRCQIDFSPNGVDQDGFPLSTWKSVYRGVLKDYGRDLFSQGNPFGEEDLRVEIAKYLRSSRGVNCTSNQILVGAGNDYLLMLLCIVFRNKKNMTGMSKMTYQKAWRIFRAYDMDVKEISMDAHGLLPKEVEEKGVQILYTMPSHHFPMGTVMPIGRRVELLKWANEKEDRYIIEDDYDSEFRYKGRTIPALAASDKKGKVIYMGSFSKSLAPAIRISYMVLPEGFLEEFQSKVGFISSSVSRLDQMTLCQFMKEGYFERHIQRMKKVYRGKRNILLKKLEEFQDDFFLSGEEAGLHIVLIDRKGRKEKDLILSAEQVGVRVYGLSKYMIGEERALPATIIIGYAENEIEEIEAGIEKLFAIWR